MKLIRSIFLSSLLLTVIFITGCNEGPTTSVDPINTGVQLSKFSLPPGATLVSATLFVHNIDTDEQNVEVHRVTSEWQENVVTWTSFGEAYDANVEGSFSTPYPPDWQSTNITGLVQNWLDGNYSNFGLLLKQPVGDFSQYDSRETGDNAPYLQICYTLNGGTICDTTRAIADTHIWERPANAGENYGNMEYFYTGFRNNYEKLALIQFELEPTPPEVSCETAYANGPNATCFLDIPNKQGNNWGWTNYIAGAFTGTQSWPIYAGAGQCDVSKGTQVGTLDVTYNGTTVTVFYNINSGFTLDETHLWIGSGMLPEKRGKYVSNPGGFNYKEQNPVSVNISAPFYIAAHSVVCGNY